MSLAGAHSVRVGTLEETEQGETMACADLERGKTMANEKSLSAKIDEETDKRMAEKLGVSVEQLRKEKAEFEAGLDGNKPAAKAEKKTRTSESRTTQKGKKNRKTAKAEAKTEGTGKGIRALANAKLRYKAKGNVDHCGDWLAVTLREEFLDDKEGFDIDGFKKCCKENGLDVTQPWATSEAPGWQGRFRMNGRQKLEIVLAREGFIKIDGKKVSPPANFAKAMEKRHPEHPEVEDEE